MSDIIYTYENLMPDKTSVVVNDFIRLVGYDNASYKALISNLAKCLVESYAGSSLAGADQTIQNAINEINNKVDLAGGGLAIATTASSMINHDTIYVYTGSETGYEYGNWYYWDGESFTSGGAVGGLTPDKTLSQDGVAADAKATGDAMSTKAEAEGEVSMAKALVGGKYTLDQSPYHYRQSPDAGALDEKIVGGTLGWNQLVAVNARTDTNNGITYTYNDDGSIMVNGTATANSHSNIGSTLHGINNHVMVMSGCPSGGSADTYRLRDGYIVGKYDTGNGFLWKKTNDNFIPQLLVDNGVTVSNLKFVPQAIDLTTLFGSTIADYIYSLEQSSAGAGVAWVRQYIDLDTYHEYCEPTLKSVEGLQSRDVVGFNQWDEEWELGAINANGTTYNSTTSIRCKNFIPVLPSTTYYMYVGANVNNSPFFYDANKTFISRNSAYIQSGTFTTPGNCCYMKIAFPVAYGTTYNHDICINLSDPSRNGQYEPYEKHSYPLDSTLELRGIPKLSDGKMYFDGDEYSSDGQVTRRYGIQLLDASTPLVAGSVSSYYYFTVTNQAKSVKTWEANIFSNLLPANDGRTTSKDRIQYDGAGNLRIISDTDGGSFTTIEEFRTWLGQRTLMVVYPLATPTTETAQPYQSPQLAGTTEEYVTTGVVPVGHESRYYEDVAEKVGGLPKDFSTLIAPTEATFTATRNYSVGNYLIVKNQLYKVTSAITSGETITPNSNATPTTIMDEILALV